MSRISNKSKYPLNQDIALSDYLLGTKSTGKTTLNFEIQNFLNTINEANGISTSQFKFSLDEDIHLTEVGYVTTNSSEIDPANITLLRFSTEDLSGNDLTVLLTAINASKDNVLIKLADPANPNSITVFEVSSIDTSNINYIDMSVTFFSNMSTVSFIEDAIYSFDYYIFQGESGIKNVVEDTTPELGGDLDALNKDINNVKELGFQAGQKLSWNTKYHTIDVPTGDGAVAKVGMDTMFDIHNATGGILTKGTVVYPDGTSTSGVSNVQKAIADTHVTLTTQLGVIAFDVLNGADGHILVQGVLDPIDTNGWSEGSVYLSSTVAGELTSVKPDWTSYHVLMGVVDSVGVSGVITIDIKFNLQNTLTNFWNGVFRESFNFLITSNGTVATGTLTPANGNVDMTMLFSDGFSLLDASPSATIALTQGTDTVPQVNYVYITKVNKVLEVSTAGFPMEEHIKVANVFLKSNTATQLEGAVINRNWNDHIQGVDGQGHLSHMAEKIRLGHADWISGAEGGLTIVGGTDVYATATGGIISQMHKQSFPAQDMQTGDDCHIMNDEITPYLTTTNLNVITTGTLGDSLLNKSFKLVLWGVQNKTVCHLMINKPTKGEGYNDPLKAQIDEKNRADYSIPKEFKGEGFLIAAITVRVSGAGVWELFAVDSIRGAYPTIGGGIGGSGGGVVSFLGLDDVPSSYLGQSKKVVQVSAGETALEFVDNIPTSGTGTVIDMSNYRGYYMNMSSANTATTYTTTGQELGGYAVVRINAASQPTVTGANMVSGSLFVSATDMHMVVQYFGTTTQYYFLTL